MKLHERLKENRELGRAEGFAKVIRNLNKAGHDSEYIANMIDDNKNLVEKIISMIESNPDIDDAAIAEVIVSREEL